MLESQAYGALLGFYVVAKHPNSSVYAFEIGTMLTEPLPQPFGCVF